MFLIQRYLKASVGISTYCTHPSLPKKRKGTDKSFIEDATFLSGSDNDEDEKEDEDNNKYLRGNFVVNNGQRMRRTKPLCLVVVRTTI